MIAYNFANLLPLSDRQYFYQLCVEFGWFQTSTLDTQPFGKYFPIEFWERQCVDIFGPKFNMDQLKRGVQETNINYGGKAIKVRKVVFVNGSIDPAHALGITRNLSGSTPAIYINGTAHCADAYPDDMNGVNDPPQLKLARITINDEIGKFLERDN
jgi:Serine carboxypeptidase S28